ELFHLDDLGEAGDAAHERILDRSADAFRERHELLGGELLVAEEHHQLLEPYAPYLGDFRITQAPQVDAGDLGAERAGDALHVHPSHAPLVRKCSCSARASSAWGRTPSLRQRCAALPAACPITKHGPETRAADWPPCVIEAQRPATSRFS